MLIKNIECVYKYIIFFLFIYKRNASNDVHVCVWTYDVDPHFQHRLILPLVSPPSSSPFSFSERLPLVYHRREVKLFALSRRYTCWRRERKTSNAEEEMRKRGDAKEVEEKGRDKVRGRRVFSWPMTASRMQAQEL